ncbi:MAG: FtsX-like permease family protein [Candidatus Zixiibacteriota bacterium]
MTLRDLILVSVHNLWRMKLRAFLTISGVVIAIAAFVSMVSFGAGNQQLVEQQFNELGLFSTMYAYPRSEENNTDSLPRPPLDQKAVQALAKIPGVNLAYPMASFSVTASIADTQVTTDAQALPSAAVQTKIFSQLRAGQAFTGDSTKQAMVSERFLELIGIEQPDSVIGKQLIVSIEASSIDSGLTRVLQSVGERVGDRAREFDIDSLTEQRYWQRIARDEMSHAMMVFVDGYMNARETISDTLIISGVLKQTRDHHVRFEPIIIPTATAVRFDKGGLSGDPMQLLTAAQTGNIFASSSDSTGKTYPRVTLDLDPSVPYAGIKDSVEALGFRAFCFAEQFDQIQKFFFYFDLALGLVGLIALVTASLGIVNTMVMSIVERTREIGVLKSLGADEGAIRVLFLVESGVIGGIGASVGITFGWLITRIASGIAKAVMRDQGIDPVELFAMPLWLVGTAFLFGLVVSLIAGFYPSSRAAKVDPVEALRND